MFTLLLVAFVNVAAAEPSVPANETTTPVDLVENRNGFTMALGLGPGVTFVVTELGTTAEFGLSGLSVATGIFLTPDFSVNAKVTGTSFSRQSVAGFDIGYQQTVVNAFAGITAQYYFSDAFYLSGGPGVGLLLAAADSNGPDLQATLGLALHLCAGYTFWKANGHRLGLSLDFTPAIFDVFGSAVENMFGTTGVGLNLEWQLL